MTNAAPAALVLYTKGHGLAVFRDGLRLVLVLFLLLAALWANVEFITLLLDIRTSALGCQIGIIFATVFDQLARFSIEQYLLWAMNSGTETTGLSLVHLVPQLLILGRFIAGAAFAGFARPQTDTFCLVASSALPVSILVIALDVVILLLLTARAFSVGLFTNMHSKNTNAARSKSLLLIMLGLVIWTAVRALISKKGNVLD